MQNFEARFRYYANNGLRIDRTLDIGAHRGFFTRLLTSFWPAAKVWQFEADDRNRTHNPEAIYTLLGNCERECDFYTLDESSGISTTGSSIYRENSDFYRDPVVMTKRMTTLDSFLGTIDFSGDWKEHGLVKIDTQGSELDILEGGRKFFEIFTPMLVLLEVSLVPYNQGAPLISDVIAYMSNIRYGPIDVLDMLYAPDGRLIQMDMLFA